MSSVDWSPQFSTLTDRIATCGGDGQVQVHRLQRRGLAEEAWGDTQTVHVKDEKVQHLHLHEKGTVLQQ